MEDEHKSKKNQHPSNSDIMSSAKVIAGAVMGGGNDKAEIAGAAAEILGAAKHYGKLEDSSYGNVLDKAEDYLHNYGNKSNNPSKTSHHGGSHIDGGVAKKGDDSYGGYGGRKKGDSNYNGGGDDDKFGGYNESQIDEYKHHSSSGGDGSRKGGSNYGGGDDYDNFGGYQESQMEGHGYHSSSSGGQGGSGYGDNIKNDQYGGGGGKHGEYDKKDHGHKGHSSGGDKGHHGHSSGGSSGGGGYGEYVKMAQGFLNKDKDGEDGNNGGYGDYIKMAEGILRK